MSLTRKESVFWASLVCLAGLRFGIVAWLPLTPDEAYYWLWSRRLQGGYLDHPAMVALWIRGGTALFGQTPLGVRCLGVAASFGASVAIWDAARCFWPTSLFAGEKAALLLNATLMFGLGMCLMTPDTPQMFFVALSVWALSHALKAFPDTCRNSPVLNRKTLLLASADWWWLACGIFLGLGMESKYTVLLIGIGVSGYVLASGLWRRIGPWLGAGAALVTLTPLLLWNSAHDWAGLAKQGGRLGHWQPERALSYLGELAASQIGLMTPLVFLCCVIGLWRARKRAPLLLWLVFPGASVFVAHALYAGRVQANWPCVLYPVLAVAGALCNGKLVRWAGGLGLGVACIVVLQAFLHPLPLSAHQDPILRLTAGWDGLERRLQQEAKTAKAQAIVVPDYALASILAFQLSGQLSGQSPTDVPIVSTDKRWAYLKGHPRVRFSPSLEIVEARHPLKTDENSLVRERNGYAVRFYLLTKNPTVDGWEVRPEHRP